MLAITPRGQLAALLIPSAAQFIVVLDFSMMNVALPAMADGVGLVEQDAQWIVSGYALSFGGLLLVGGRVADLYGRRRAFVAGLTLFALGAMNAALAWSPISLIVARTVQGIGAALLVPSALSLITTGFREGQSRERALGVYGAVFSGGFVVGAPLAGVLVELWSWRVVLIVDVVLAISAAIRGSLLLKETETFSEQRRLDVRGALIGTAAIVTFVFALASIRTASVSWLATLVGFSATMVLCAWFVSVERDCPYPLAPPQVIARARVLAATLAVGLGTGGAAGATLVITLYLQDALGYSAIATGLIFTLFGATAVVGGAATPLLLSALGVTLGVTGMLAIQVAGVIALTLSLGSATLTSLLSGIALLGLGHIGSIIGLTIAATGGLPEYDQGMAGGLINTCNEIGGGLGMVVLSTVAGMSSEAVAHAEDSPTGAALTAGFEYAMLGAVGLSAVALLVAGALLGLGGRSRGLRVPMGRAR